MNRIQWAAWPALLLIAACGQAPAPASASIDPQRIPPQAGEPLDAVETAARLTAIRIAALAGDEEAVRREVGQMQGDLLRSMKIPDVGRPIDRERGRSAAGAVSGVRFVVWIDRDNLLAMVDGEDARNQRTIDQICYRLETLGDTLAVVVNLQNAAAQNGDELEILSRNCQLEPGDRAFMQQNRMVDVLDPAIRDQHETNQILMQDAAARKAEDDAANEAALLSIPEM